MKKGVVRRIDRLDVAPAPLFDELVEAQRERFMRKMVEHVGAMAEKVADEMFGAPSSAPQEQAPRLKGVPASHSNESVTMEDVEKIVSRVLDTTLKSLLTDVSYRIGVLADQIAKSKGYETGRVSAHELNIAHHILDGYTFSDNSPQNGYIAWTDCHISYKGSTYTIEDGNTNQKYVYWVMTQPTKFAVSNTKPNLGPDDVLVAVNDNGKARVVLTPGKLQPGAILLDGSVNSSELADEAVTSTKIAALAIVEGKIADGAISTNKLANNAVNSAKIADGAVVAGKIGSGAINNSNLFTSGVVNANALSSNAVTEGKIANGAVTQNKIANGAVVSDKLANGAVTTIKIADSAVDSDKIANGAVVADKIGPGAVAANKLNLAQHLLF